MERDSIFRPVHQVLARAGLGPEAVDLVLLAGSSSRIPQVQQALRSYFETAHLLGLGDERDVQGAIARGAALQALAAEAPGSFDVVTCMEMLEHVPDPQSVVRACATLVKPGGAVCFSTLNRNLKSYALAVLGAEYVLNMLPRGTHEYARFLKPSELARMARHAGLDVSDICGMSYNPLTQVYRLGEDSAVNYLMGCRRIG